MAKKQTGKISQRMQRRAAERSKKRRTQLIVALIVILVVAIGGAIIFTSRDTGTSAATGPLPQFVSVEEAYELVEDGAFLLDVRTQEEWDNFHATQATLIPLDQLEARVSEVPVDQDVVVICNSGNRSQVGRDILIEAGHPAATSVNGGMQAWRANGYPTE